MVSKLVLLAATLVASAMALPASEQPTPASESAAAMPSVIPPIQEDQAVDSPELRQAKKVKADLEKNFSFTSSNAPYFTEESGIILVSNTGKLDKVTIDHLPTRDAALANTAQGVAALRTLQSTAQTQSTSSGWKVGGRASLKAGDLSLDFSADYSSTTTSSNTVTKSVDLKMDCPSQHYCEIQTWTFFAKVKGQCKSEPWAHCGRERNLCSIRDWAPFPFVHTWTGCKQFADRKELCFKDEITVCEFVIPVLDASGNPLSTQVTLARKN